MILKPPKGAMINRGRARGLVGYWLMNEGSGNIVRDLSGNGNHGTLVADTHWVPGKFGSCLSFDGTGDYVDCGSPDIVEGISSFSVSAWAKLSTSVPSRTRHIIVSQGSVSGTGIFVLFVQDANPDTFRFMVINASSSVATADMAVAPDFSLWHHVVGVYNGTNVLLYVDTVLQADQPALTGLTGSTADPLEISRDVTQDWFWNGSIDDVMIYNRALSASEIAQLYREPFLMLEEDL